MSKHRRNSDKLGKSNPPKSQPEKDNSANHMDYEVGYGKPPKHSQFKKGQSGNPAGRPKEPTTFIDCMNKELSRNVKILKDGKEYKTTELSAVSKKYINMVLGGNTKLMTLFIKETAKDVNIEPYLYPNEEEELLKPPSEALQEVKAIIHQAMSEKIHNGETIYEDKPKE